MTHHSIKGDNLQKSVTVTNENENFKLDFRLPAFGEYGVNIYAAKLNEPQRLHHVHTYFVKCRTSQASTNEKSQKTMKTKFMFVEDDAVDVEVITKKMSLAAQLRRKHVRSKMIAAKTIDIRYLVEKIED